jgi:hypothetical protein
MGKRLRAVVATCALLFASGCVVEASTAPPPGVAVAVPPPAPMSETRPAAPTPKSTWVAGYWHWTGMQYAWIPGHWAEPPAGETWRAPRYSLHDGTYFYEPGGWWTPPRDEH